MSNFYPSVFFSNVYKRRLYEEIPLFCAAWMVGGTRMNECYFKPLQL